MGLEIHSIKCTTDPISAPTDCNQHWVNSTTGALYISNGTDSVGNWILINGIISLVDDVDPAEAKEVDSTPLAEFCAIEYFICISSPTSGLHKALKAVVTKAPASDVVWSTYAIIGGGLDVDIDVSAVASDQKLIFTNNETSSVNIRITKTIVRE